jgi:hypothetical protein
MTLLPFPNASLKKEPGAPYEAAVRRFFWCRIDFAGWMRYTEGMNSGGEEDGYGRTDSVSG